jgi:uncharacterized protein (TIGR02646 family)
MRRLRRIVLPPKILSALAAYQDTLDRAIPTESAKPAPRLSELIETAWGARRANAALRGVELALAAMSSGLKRCMYCEDSQGCDVEHFRPKGPHPDSTFHWSNLLWICAICNRQKNDAFEPGMLDPTVDDPLDHLVLSLATGKCVVRNASPRGAATLRAVPRLVDEQTLLRGRHNAFIKLRTLLLDYHLLKAQGQQAKADEIRRAVVEEPFSAVFAAFLRASTESGASDVLGEEVVEILKLIPEVHRWLEDADDARQAAAEPEILALAAQVRIRRV